MLNYSLAWLNNNMLGLTLALACATIILLILLIILYLRVNNLSKNHRSLMTGMDGKNLEELLTWYLNKVGAAENKVAELKNVCGKLEEYTQRSLQKVALIRFNAFDDMGGDLSFATALLDLDGNGFVLSSINSREESRVYAKPIVTGNSTYNLSKEEKQAISLAMQNKNVKS